MTKTSHCAEHEERRVPFVLIVEDHPLVAASLVACVRECDDQLTVVATESLGAALDQLTQRQAPLLIVTDLSLPDTQGMEAVRRLREAAPASPLLVVTALDDPLLRSQARELGAVGYLIKSTSIQILRDEIRALLGGRTRVKNATPAGGGIPGGLLTRKQLAVLEELVAGRSNKEIAVRMKLSEETVGSHMKEILGRLAVRNRTEAVVRYLQMLNPPHGRQRG